MTNGSITLRFHHLLYRNIENNSKNVKSVVLLLIALYCKTVWMKRNAKKYDRKHVLPADIYIFYLQQLKLRILADFERLSYPKFSEFWCFSDLFCKVQDENLDITFF